MAFVFRFTAPGMTAAKYDETVKRLEQAGAGSPAGRLFHVCFGDKENLKVSDIWDSRESLQELCVDVGEPEFIEVHNIIEGAKADTAKP